MRIAAITFALFLGACAAASTDGPPDGQSVGLPDGASEELDECTPDHPYGSCTPEGGGTGVRTCEVGEHGYVWSACARALCEPWVVTGGCVPCVLADGVWKLGADRCGTPLVLAFDDEPVTFTAAEGAFDLAGRDTLARTDWVGSETPWLVLDRNANGRIDDGTELFGSMTRLPGGERAEHGFLALAPLDTDRDGWLTASDPAFAELALWHDRDQDRLSSADELTPAAESVIALSLDYRDVPRCRDGNCERERAELVYRDRDGNERRGSVVDVYLLLR